MDAQTDQDFKLNQPQNKVSVKPGETLTLNCTVSGSAPLGPVKWLKGWGSENKTIYEDTGTVPRVTRAVSGSNTDFTIHIKDIQPEDGGTYYCVKFRRLLTGVDEVFQHGSGTKVSVYVFTEAALVPGMVAAAVVLCFLLLLGLFVALYLCRRKRQGGVGSPRPAGQAAKGSFPPSPLQRSAGTPGTSSFSTMRGVLDAERSYLPSQHSIMDENDIHYIDLEPLPMAPWYGRSLGTACTEYASLRVAAK